MAQRLARVGQRCDGKIRDRAQIADHLLRGAVPHRAIHADGVDGKLIQPPRDLRGRMSAGGSDAEIERHERDQGERRHVPDAGHGRRELSEIAEGLAHEQVHTFGVQGLSLLSEAGSQLGVTRQIFLKAARPDGPGDQARSRLFPGQSNARPVELLDEVCASGQSEAIGSKGVGGKGHGSGVPVLAVHLPDKIRPIQGEKIDRTGRFRDQSEQLGAHGSVEEQGRRVRHPGVESRRCHRIKIVSQGEVWGSIWRVTAR